MPSPEKAFVVIPAFNEGQTIQPIIESVQNADPDLINTDYILVVNNNSTDDTVEKAHSAGATVLTCERQGKGWAMNSGIRYVRSLGASAVTFLDADLVKLTPDHVNQLTEPVLKDEAIMTIGYLGGRKSWTKQIYERWGMFSGQRTVSMSILNELTEADLKKARTEGALNAITRNMGINNRIVRTELEDLWHNGYRQKCLDKGFAPDEAYRKAAVHYAKTYTSAIRGLMSRSGKTSGAFPARSAGHATYQ